MGIGVILLLIFGGLMYRLIRFSRESTGDGSPLEKQVTYQTTEWQYFTRFDLLSTVFLGFVCLYLPYVVVAYGLPAAKTVWHYAIAIGLVGVCGWALYYIWIWFRLNNQYWQLTRDVLVTLDPADKRVFLQYPDYTVSFTAADATRVELVGTGSKGSKLFSGFTYWRFHLTDGLIVYLNNNSSFLTHIQEVYFGQVPFRYEGKRIPWIDREVISESAEA
ncbi:hypothetical protein F5984_06675 [Rudanella paleaurantiibacter]|uniref:PH domain-containing protein n=1 Tax=Rudanella paleaurantiibacter TaxID=2614655 RepID=A0A7J5U341_9BACT|nr:hypothetical protein [Rudanella paleaurantiibacter]KAB7731902.1 hypothetical protein F5984_06675 [Rudanella paleaurantiibacter]